MWNEQQRPVRERRCFAVLVERRIVGEIAIFANHHKQDGRYSLPRPLILFCQTSPTYRLSDPSRLQRTSSSFHPPQRPITLPCHIDTRPILQTNSRPLSKTHQASSHLTEQGLIDHMSALSTSASTTLDPSEEPRFLCLNLLTAMYPTEITQPPSSSSKYIFSIELPLSQSLSITVTLHLMPDYPASLPFSISSSTKNKLLETGLHTQCTKFLATTVEEGSDDDLTFLASELITFVSNLPPPVSPAPPPSSPPKPIAVPASARPLAAGRAVAAPRVASRRAASLHLTAQTPMHWHRLFARCDCSL